MEQWKSFRVFMKIVIALPMVLVEPGRRNAWTFNPNCKTFFLKIPCHEQFSTSTWPRFRGSADRKSLHARDLELGNWGDSLGSRGICGPWGSDSWRRWALWCNAWDEEYLHFAWNLIFFFGMGKALWGEFFFLLLVLLILLLSLITNFILWLLILSVSCRDIVSWGLWVGGIGSISIFHRIAACLLPFAQEIRKPGHRWGFSGSRNLWFCWYMILLEVSGSSIFALCYITSFESTP